MRRYFSSANMFYGITRPFWVFSYSEVWCYNLEILPETGRNAPCCRATIGPRESVTGCIMLSCWTLLCRKCSWNPWLECVKCAFVTSEAAISEWVVDGICRQIWKIIILREFAVLSVNIILIGDSGKRKSLYCRQSALCMCCLTTSAADIEKHRSVRRSVMWVRKVVERSACGLKTVTLVSFDCRPTEYSRPAGRDLKRNLPRPTLGPWTFRTRTSKHSTATVKVVLPFGNTVVEWTECLSCGATVK
jgi:hypothetical protein